MSPHLKCFDRQLLAQLAKSHPVRTWEYIQTVDEPCCLDSVVDELHQYVSGRAALEQRSGQADYRVHLLGHGVSGVVGLMYARLYPERVASLTLLSVDAAPAVNWQAHYYALRQLLPCSREIILIQMAKMMVGHQPHRFSRALAKLLARDLDSCLSLHSLAHDVDIPIGAAEVPLLVCNGEHDSIIQAQRAVLWRKCMKSGDRLWQCPEGHHFFHFHHAASTSKVITEHITANAKRDNKRHPQPEIACSNIRFSQASVSRSA